jgi:hypothetical protein
MNEAVYSVRKTEEGRGEFQQSANYLNWAYLDMLMSLTLRGRQRRATLPCIYYVK